KQRRRSGGKNIYIPQFSDGYVNPFEVYAVYIVCEIFDLRDKIFRKGIIAMRTVSTILCFCLLTILNTGVAHSQWKHTNGLNGGYIYCFALSGTNIFAGTGGSGVFL